MVLLIQRWSNCNKCKILDFSKFGGFCVFVLCRY